MTEIQIQDDFDLDKIARSVQYFRWRLDGQEVTKQGFPLDLLHKLMACEVNEPSGVVLHLEDPCWPRRILPFTNTLSSPGITYTFRHMCCQSHHVAW